MRPRKPNRPRVGDSDSAKVWLRRFLEDLDSLSVIKEESKISFDFPYHNKSMGTNHSNTANVGFLLCPLCDLHTVYLPLLAKGPIRYQGQNISPGSEHATSNEKIIMSLLQIPEVMAQGGRAMKDSMTNDTANHASGFRDTLLALPLSEHTNREQERRLQQRDKEYANYDSYEHDYSWKLSLIHI